MNAILPFREPSRELLTVSTSTSVFNYERSEYVVPRGLTVAEIVMRVSSDPMVHALGVVHIGDSVIPREMWHLVRPKPGAIVSISVAPRGGGGWRIAALIGVAALAIAVTVATGGLATPLLGATGAGVLGGLAGAAITIGGGLLVNMLLPPPVPQLSRNYGNDPQTYAIANQRNQARPWSKVPFVCGSFKVTPAYGAMPYREVSGGDIYWRALFAIGHGPLGMDGFAIGQTAVENFQGVEIEYRRGFWSMPIKGDWNAATGAFPSTAPNFGDTWNCVVSGTVDGRYYVAGQSVTYNGYNANSLHAWDIDQEKPFSLFPSDVYEDSLAAKVTYGNPPVRTTQLGADEVGIELIFERGLVHIQNFPAGKRSDATMTVAIQQSPAGANNWATVLQTTITGRQTSPLYWGHRWKTTDFGAQHADRQYDIRVFNMSGERDEERNFGNFTWYALRSFTMRNPVPVTGIAMIAIRVKASGQLSGTLDEFNCVAHSMCQDWDSFTGTWRWRVTSSPAAIYRHMLQHAKRQRPITDAQIDLDRLAYWDGITRAAGRNFNGVFDAKGSLYDALTEVCRIGRAVPSLRSMRYSVIIDELKTVPVRMFTPANSWDYQGEMSYAAVPNAYRIGYVDKSRDHTVQEVMVYDDGYSPANAVTTDLVQWIGVDNKDQAWKEGRFHLAQQRLRRETHKITTDFEHLCCERGDLVALQYDTIAVGLGATRVVSVEEQGAMVVRITLAAPVTMEFGKNYGIRVRRVVNDRQRTDIYLVYTEEGDQTLLAFQSPPSIIDAPKAGDLVAFGEANRESLRVLIRDIEPKNDLSAVLTMIAEAPGVHSAEFGTIPPLDPMVTRPSRLPAPMVLSVASDARVMLVTASRALIDRVVFGLQPISIDGAYARVTYRLLGTSGSWQTATVQEETVSSIAIIGVEAGESYDFRIQYLHANYLGSPITAINSYYVVGRTAPPDDLQNLSLSVVSGQALLRWDLPADLDVQVGGWIMFRHSPLDDDTAFWPNTTTIAQAVVGDQTHAFLPLLPGTYFGRPYDADGRGAVNPVKVMTKQASVLAFSPIGAVQEDPTFTGEKTNCHLFESGLMLDANDFDSVADTDLLADWDVNGQLASFGLYKFAAGIDLGEVSRARVTSHLYVNAINEFDFIDDRTTNIDSWEDVDGTTAANVDASIYAKMTDDDPAGTPTWGDFVRIDSIEIENRAVGHMECRMYTNDTAFNVWLLQCRVTAEQVNISPTTIDLDLDGGGPAD